MGHAVFAALHLAALLFSGWFWLLVTIPLHLIYATVSAKPKRVAIPGPGDIAEGMAATVPCPECREPVRSDARRCKHCGAALTPSART